MVKVCPDELWIESFQGQDSQAFEELINQYKAYVFAIILRIVSDPEEAQDIAQEVFIPVIWFYSVFDIYHLLEDEEKVQLESSTLFDWFSNHPGWLGWGLIALGLLVIVQRIASPALAQLLSESLRSYIETSFIALILIAGGIKLLLGSKAEEPREGANALPAIRIEAKKADESAFPDKTNEEIVIENTSNVELNEETKEELS